jgi:FkbM family methyltransferase
MVAANKGNPSRKAFQQQLEAFKEFKKTHNDAVMYIHTGKAEHGENGGVNLPNFCNYLGLREGVDIFFPNNYQNLIGFPDEWMNLLYNSFDVLTNVSTGEGFGIPIVEAQAAGTPVIVGDWTSMKELCFSGWRIGKVEAEPIWTPIASYQYQPHSSAIAERYKAAFHKKDNEVYRNRARDGAMEYDADVVFEKYWIPTLEAIAAKVEDDKAHKSSINHQHAWGAIGLYNKDGSMSVPCVGCDDELVVDKEQNRSITKGGFKHDYPLSFVPDTDGITKIVTREIQRDYDLDGLDLKEGDIVIDIGAHKGIVSCYLAKKYPGCKVLAFEPVKENFDALILNMNNNNLKNISPYNLAVTNDGRPVMVYSDPVTNSGGATIYCNDASNKQVQSITLAEIFRLNSIDRLALLKIDCEGAEHEIIGGAGDLLKRVDHLRGEFHNNYGNSAQTLAIAQAAIPDIKVTMFGS